MFRANMNFGNGSECVSLSSKYTGGNNQKLNLMRNSQDNQFSKNSFSNRKSHTMNKTQKGTILYGNSNSKNNSYDKLSAAKIKNQKASSNSNANTTSMV